MSDLLSASSLLLAIAAILFSLWYPEIVRALKLEDTMKKFKLDNVGARKDVSSVILSKALPVAIVSLSVTSIFLPDALRIAKDSFDIYAKVGFLVLENYDAVRTAYCFVTVLSAFLTVYMWVLVYDLFFLWRKLGRDM